jgi:hypothetical protein
MLQNMLGDAGFLCDKTALLRRTQSKEHNILERVSVSKPFKAKLF